MKIDEKGKPKNLPVSRSIGTMRRWTRKESWKGYVICQGAMHLFIFSSCILFEKAF